MVQTPTPSGCHCGPLSTPNPQLLYKWDICKLYVFINFIIIYKISSVDLFGAPKTFFFITHPPFFYWIWAEPFFYYYTYTLLSWWTDRSVVTLRKQLLSCRSSGKFLSSSSSYFCLNHGFSQFICFLSGRLVISEVTLMRCLLRLHYLFSILSTFQRFDGGLCVGVRRGGGDVFIIENNKEDGSL